VTTSLALALLAVAIVLAPGAVVPAPAAIEIVDDPRAITSQRIDVGRRFGATGCPTRPPGKTVLEALGDARKILIHQFDAHEWSSFETVRDYVLRLLSAAPEGDRLAPTVYWAESRLTEVFASVEFPRGQPRPLRVANGYVHVQDAAGCEWWARYLGPDPSKWIVRP
jgi:hypothetical protein